MLLTVSCFYLQLKSATQVAAVAPSSNTGTSETTSAEIQQSPSVTPVDQEVDESLVIESGSLFQAPVYPPPSKRARQAESSESEDIMTVLRDSNDRTQRTLDSNACKVSQAHPLPDMRQAWCRWMEAATREIHPSLWRAFTDQTYQLINQLLDQSAVLRQAEES